MRIRDTIKAMDGYRVRRVRHVTTGEDAMTDGIIACILDTLSCEYRADEDTKLIVDIKMEELK